jgi:hypothetical protein
VEWKDDTYLEAMEDGIEWNFDAKIAVENTEQSGECSTAAVKLAFSTVLDFIVTKKLCCLMGAEKH